MLVIRAGIAALRPARSQFYTGSTFSKAHALAQPSRAFFSRSQLSVKAGIVEDVSAQMKEAMKSKNTERLAALRNMRAAFLTAMKENNAETLADDKAVETLRKMAKQRLDSITQFRQGGREEMAQQEERELAILESFCPKLADADTTRKWVEEAIKQIGASKPGDVGKVIGAVVKAHKGEVDNALVKAEAEKILGGGGAAGKK